MPKIQHLVDGRVDLKSSLRHAPEKEVPFKLVKTPKSSNDYDENWAVVRGLPLRNRLGVVIQGLTILLPL